MRDLTATRFRYGLMRLSFLGVALGSLLSLCAFLSLVLLDQFPETVRNSTLLIVYGVLAFAAYGTIAGLVDVWIISVVRRIGDGGNARLAATAITRCEAVGPRHRLDNGHIFLRKPDKREQKLGLVRERGFG